MNEIYVLREFCLYANLSDCLGVYKGKELKKALIICEQS